MNTIEEMIEDYVKCRDHMNATTKKCKKHMQLLEGEIMTLSDAQGVDGFKTKFGTAFKKTTPFIEIVEWETALDFIIDNDLKHMLPRSVKKTSAIEYREENNNELPPGLKYGTRVGINVTRSR